MKSLRLTLSLTLSLLLGTPPAAAEPRVLHFGTEPFPPYVIERQGRAVGPMVDVLRATCESLGWRCELALLPWRRALAEAESGRLDGLFPLLQTAERERLFHFSSPVLNARYALFSRSGQSYRYEGPASLEGHELGVYGPSGTSLALNELLQDAPTVPVHVEPDNATVLRKLVHGRYGEQGLAFVNESVALWLLKQEQLQGLQMAGVAREISYGYGLLRARLTEADFQRFDEALQANCRSGRTAALVRPYALPASACVVRMPR
ncbi:MAG TPA: transporter substrate-binding domain-containing protein [Burkholderiaceae bacterium]|nr:transporter substrate-binding domain-containing protein [Burkholderiaceae bacterium]